MAKHQGLSLNPTKISGLCGRLMCCLKYEDQYYADTLKFMPKVNQQVNTPNGEGTVVSVDMLRQTVIARITAKDSSTELHEYTLTELGITPVYPDICEECNITDDDETDELPTEE